ncbi:MAG TPA: histidine triad nucleotide-binding protein [Firmicutes bacterium]|nr:histidine triad nucleotide-binding protein [Bacillota bacterium]
MGKEDTGECIFCEIIGRTKPADIIYEDDRVVAFKDKRPRAPVHVLVIPRKHIPTLFDLTDEDENLIGHIHLVAARLARQLGAVDGFRVVVNCGARAGQTVYHLHFHILAGRPLGWPPG